MRGQRTTGYPSSMALRRTSGLSWRHQKMRVLSRGSFEALTQKLATCTDVPPVRDQGVNHPDFYDAWAFIIDGAPVTLSIKDKTALGKTFVVLRGSMSEMRRN